MSIYYVLITGANIYSIKFLKPFYKWNSVVTPHSLKGKTEIWTSSLFVAGGNVLICIQAVRIQILCY